MVNPIGFLKSEQKYECCYAAIANLPPVDSIDMWPYLSGKVGASPRTVIHMDTGVAVQGDLKILMTESKQACWAGPRYPNGSDPSCTRLEKCNPCLYVHS